MEGTEGTGGMGGTEGGVIGDGASQVYIFICERLLLTKCKALGHKRGKHTCSFTQEKYLEWPMYCLPCVLSFACKLALPPLLSTRLGDSHRGKHHAPGHVSA